MEELYKKLFIFFSSLQNYISVNECQDVGNCKSFWIYLIGDELSAKIIKIGYNKKDDVLWYGKNLIYNTVREVEDIYYLFSLIPSFKNFLIKNFNLFKLCQLL